MKDPSDDSRGFVRSDPAGLLVSSARFVVDAKRRVDRAVVSHAHFDHVTRGCGEYYASRPGAELLRQRLPRSAVIHAFDFSQRFKIGDVILSFHPAGHILGSAQVRLEEPSGRVWVISGDYKRQDDISCESFEPVPCDVFITESTFAQPRFVWPDPATVMDSIVEWWHERRARGGVSVIYAYVLGKAQRLLAELGQRDAGRVWVHPEIEVFNATYRRFGIDLGKSEVLPRRMDPSRVVGDLIIAPPRYFTPTWYARFGDVETAIVSGWPSAEFGGARAAPERCFPLSDHVDWPGLLRTIEESAATSVRTIHGDSTALVEHLIAKGVDAAPLDSTIQADN